MPKDVLDEREFELINIIGPRIDANQRDLSRQMSLSLGMINMLIRRLISKGFIRINQLNKRKVEYILTPKGFAEKMRQSVKYTVKTVNSITHISNRLKDVIGPIINQGEDQFFIVGDCDFATLVKNIIKDMCSQEPVIAHIDVIPDEPVKGTILICKEEYADHPIPHKDKGVNLIEELAKDYSSLVGKS